MKILNIGSLNIDKTYTVEHLVRPKETIKTLKYEEFCGGKGLNQSLALSRAGAEVYHCGAVGPDGDGLLSMLKDSGVNTDLIKKVDCVSGHAIIQVDSSGENSIIIYGGANDKVEKDQIDNAIKLFDQDDILLIQNETSNVDYAIERAKEAGMKIAFNPAPINEAVFRCNIGFIDYLIVNEIEGKALSDSSTEDPREIITNLKARYPETAIVLTLGELGSVLSVKDKFVYQPIFPVNVVDTTAAGDTFCGYFLAGLSKGWDYEYIMKCASAASALSVTVKGAAPGIPVLDKVETFLDTSR